MNKKLFSSLYKSFYPFSFITKNSYRRLHKCSSVKPNSKLPNFWCPSFQIVPYSHSSHEHFTATYEEVKEIGKSRRKDVVLIDVREPEELSETGVLPSSINIPLGNLESVLKEMSDEEFLKVYGKKKPSRDKQIIFSCKMGKRSAQACDISQQLGFKNIKNYTGGWLEWDERKSELNVSCSTPDKSSEQYPQVSYEEVRRLKDDPNYILIDVREPSELKEHGSIPGSINIPLDNLENVLTCMSVNEFKTKYGREKPNKKSNIIFSCRSGRRSQLAQEKAIALGFKNAVNYSGSWLDWEEQTKKDNK